MTYILYSLILFFVGYLLSDQRSVKKGYYTVLYFAIVLFWGLSYFEAPDTPGYIAKYNFDIQPFPGPIDLQFELGYTLLAMMFKTIGASYWIFQIVVFASEVLLIFKGLTKFYDDRSMMFILPLLFFIYPSNLAAFRQGMAISIFIYALRFVYDENLKKSLLFFLFILIATFFHQSAFLLTLVYPARFIKKIMSKDWAVIVLLVIGDIIWLSGGSLVDQLDFMVPFFRGETLDMGQKYADMIEGDSFANYGLAKVLELNITVILYTLFCKNDKDYQLMRFNMLIYVIVGLTLGGILAHRLNYYWTILYYVAFIRGVMSLFAKQRALNVGYLLVAGYMFWFWIIKSGYYMNQYQFLFGY